MENERLPIIVFWISMIPLLLFFFGGILLMYNWNNFAAGSILLIIYLLIGFFLIFEPIIGFILSIIGLFRLKGYSKKGKIYVVISLILSIIYLFLLFLIILAAMAFRSFL
jgi:hypothetical protein